MGIMEQAAQTTDRTEGSDRGMDDESQMVRVISATTLSGVARAHSDPMVMQETGARSVSIDASDGSSGVSEEVLRPEGVSDEAVPAPEVVGDPPATESSSPENEEHEADVAARAAKAHGEVEEDVVLGPAPDAAARDGEAGTDAAPNAIAPSSNGESKDSSEVDPPSAESTPEQRMSYREAMLRTDLDEMQRGYVDIDERIRDYARTGRRDLLDKPSRASVKRDKKEQRSGSIDEKLEEARQVRNGPLTSKDVEEEINAGRSSGARAGMAESLRRLARGPGSTRGDRETGVSGRQTQPASENGSAARAGADARPVPEGGSGSGPAVENPGSGDAPVVTQGLDPELVLAAMSGRSGPGL